MEPHIISPVLLYFIEFIRFVFNATEQAIVPRREGLIMHSELRIIDSVIMFSGSTEAFSPRSAGLFICADNVDDIYREALEKGAISKMEPVTQPYGYTRGLRGLFGNDWWPVEIPVQP